MTPEYERLQKASQGLLEAHWRLYRAVGDLAEGKDQGLADEAQRLCHEAGDLRAKILSALEALEQDAP